MKFFKHPPLSVIIFLEFIGREHFRLGRELVRYPGYLFYHLPGILGGNLY